MSDTATTGWCDGREYEVPAEIAKVQRLVPEPAQNELLVLPDRVGSDDRGPWVAFRPESQLLRTAGQEAGVTVRLAVPPGYRVREYREHDASLVLPIVQAAIGAGSLIVGILNTWRRSRKGNDVHQNVRVRVREVTTVEKNGERSQTVREWEWVSADEQDLD